MAKIPDGVLSGFRGRIGNIVGVKRHDEYYVRSQPSYINDKKSPAQLRQRSKMEIVSPLARNLKEFITYTFGTVKPHRPRDPFLSVNLKTAVKTVNGDNELDYSGLMVSTGALKNVENPKAERISKNKIRFKWSDNSHMTMARADDRVLLLGLYKHGRHHYPLFETDTAKRQDEEAVLQISPVIEDFTFQAYICTLHADRSMASNSEFLGAF